MASLLASLFVSLTIVSSVHAVFPSLLLGLGDSYAAGLGAGNLLDSEFREKPRYGCLQFDGGYVHKLLGLAFPGSSEDTIRSANLACSGAKIQDVINDQIPNVGKADLITLQVGGNDVGFADILGNCVMNSCFPLACSIRNCDDALTAGTDIVENQIQAKLLGAYQALQQNILPEAHVLVIGYTQFWNAVTDQCDDADWGVLRSNKMEKSKREAMNKLSRAMNEKIEAAVSQLGDPRFVFVNPDTFFEGHRFCEDGIEEPQHEGQERPDLFVHEWYTPLGQFDGTILDPALDGFWNTISDSVLQELNGFGTNERNFSSAFPDELIQADLTSPNGGLPPKMAAYFKVFHPTQAGHDAIVQAILAKVNAVPNRAGTNMHPNETCILVSADVPNGRQGPMLACHDIQGSVNLWDQGLEDSTATVMLIPTARFDLPLLTPTAVATVSWPRYYGDVRLNEDNCLVDAGFNSIGSQCASIASIAPVGNPDFGQLPGTTSNPTPLLGAEPTTIPFSSITSLEGVEPTAALPISIFMPRGVARTPAPEPTVTY